MENKMEVFNNSEFGSVRVLEMDGTPWFVGKDVAKILGYTNPSKALADHVDEEDKLNNESLSSLGQRGGWLINESGLYSLILSSKLPAAKKFKRWVTSEVLPAIRKTGGYIPTEDLSDSEIMARALLIAQKSIEEKNAQLERQAQKIEEDAPKVLFANSVAASKSSILVYDLAKMMRQNDIDMGGRRLFEWLRDHGYLVRRHGKDYNMPTQRSMEMGLFEIKETAITHSDGRITTKRTPLVSGKGQVYFLTKFLEAQLPAAT